MRGGHTKQKSAPKKVENVAVNDTPTSTTRRSKVVRGKEEADKLAEAMPQQQGRRRRTSSRSRSGDQSTEREKGAPKTRSSELVSSISRSAGKRNVGTPKKVDAEKCKPNSKKECDKNSNIKETPLKRKATRKDGTESDKVVAVKLRTPPSDRTPEKRTLRGTSGKQTRNVGQGARNKDKEGKLAANVNKRKGSEVSSVKNVVEKETPAATNERSDSETESETELSGKFVYIDTDEGDKKATGVTDVTGGNENRAATEGNNTDSDKDDDKLEESGVDIISNSKVDGTENKNTNEKNNDENVVSKKIDETTINKSNDENNEQNPIHESVNSGILGNNHVNNDNDPAICELSKLASVGGEQSAESEVLSAELELHLDDSFEHEPLETCEATPSEVQNDGIAEKGVNLINEATQSSGNDVKTDFQKMDLEDLSAGTSLTNSETGVGLIIPDEKVACDEGRSSVNIQKATDKTDEAASDRKNEQSFWLDERAHNASDVCIDEAVGESKVQSIHRTGVDSDSCSTVSTNNEVNSPGPHQGRSKHRGPIRPGIDFTQGSRLEACDFMAKWYPSKIIDVDWKEHEVLIHFERWSSRFDEWVSMDSPRLRAITRTSARKEFRQKLQDVYKIGETVLARWVDGKMYPAKIAAFNPNGSFQVVFHDDGIQKTVKYTNISKLKEDQALQLSLDKVTAPLLTEKKKILEVPSRSSSREKKPPKRSLSPDDTPPLAGKSPKMQKKTERTQDVQDQKPKRIFKNEKRTGASGVGVKRRKLIVGGIFQAKRPQTDADSPKRSTPIQRSQPAGNNRKPAKRPRLEMTTETQLKDTEAKVDPVENSENSLLTTECAVGLDEELGEDGQLKKKLSGGHAPKEFIIEEDHNHFKCPIDDCGKGFRKETLLASHMKHYHKAGNKADGRRRNESEGSRGENVGIKASAPVDVLKENAGASEKHEAEKRNARSKLCEVQKKPESIFDPLSELPNEDKEAKKIRAKPDFVPTKPREAGKKGPMGSRQKMEDGKQPGAQRRRIPGDVNKGERRRMEAKAKAGPSHSLKEEDKDSVKSRNIGVKEKLKRRKVGALRGVEKHVPESTEDECPSKMVAFGDENASPVKDATLSMVSSPRGAEQSTGSQTIRRSGKKRKPGLAASQPKEEPSSSVGDSGVLRSPTELGEFPAYEDDDDGGREEVVNCICRIREEDGLMMQCENCMAWQHGACFNIEEEEKVPNKYICFACKSPQGQRESYRYWYDQDWWKVGEMACFNFLSKDHHPQSLPGSMYKTHALASSVYSVDHVLRSLRVKLEVAKKLEHPDLQLWNKPWSDGNQCGSNPAVVQTPGGSANSKQKGELSYCDHSYSAPNRNVFSKQEILSVDSSPLNTLGDVAEGMPTTQAKPLIVKSDSWSGCQEESTSTPLAGDSAIIQTEGVPTSQTEPAALLHHEGVELLQDHKQKELLEQPGDCTGDVRNDVGNGSKASSSEKLVPPSTSELVASSSENKADLVPRMGVEGVTSTQVAADIDAGLALSSATTLRCPLSKSEEVEVKEECLQVGQNNVPSKLEMDETKTVPQELAVKTEPVAAVQSSTPQPMAVGQQPVDPIDCQLNLLDHIEQMQEELDRRLEEISQHVESLEMEYDIPAAASHRETLADMPSTKRLVRLMQFNLSKVQRMAALQ